MKSIKLCEYSRSRSFRDDLILQDQASGERSQDQWTSGYYVKTTLQISYQNFCFTNKDSATFSPIIYVNLYAVLDITLINAGPKASL